MDLQALCEGSYEDALAAVEKRAAAVKAAGGLLDQAKGLGTRANNWVNQQIGSAARAGAADRIGNWWRETSADPAKLGLMGLGAGAGLGALGSLTAPRGRRRPLYGAMLGGLMGGAALGGYGLLTGGLDRYTAGRNLEAAKADATAAKQDVVTQEQAADPRSVVNAVGRGGVDTVKRLAAGDIEGGIEAGKKTLSNADVLGLQELGDFSGRNDRLAPSTFVNQAVRKGTGLAADAGILDRPGEAEQLANYLKLPTFNPAAEGVAGAAALDAASTLRHRSASNPNFIQAGVRSKDGLQLLQNHFVGDPDKANRAAAYINNPGAKGLRHAAGGVTGWSRLGIGQGLNVPGTPGSTVAPALHVPQSVVRQLGGIGRTQPGVAPMGWKGSLGLRAPLYAAIPASINWTQTRAQDLDAARAAASKAVTAEGTAQGAVDALGARPSLLRPRPAPLPPPPAPAPAPGVP